MELHNHSSKSARLAKHGKGPRTCVEEKGSSTAGLGQRCSSSNCFTFLQLQELQHQLLIYKYIETGLPVPFHLLVPICKSLANSVPALKGLGFIGPLNYYCEYRNSSLEAEPGRCRRTDGKKWRCTKDVVNPDQKVLSDALAPRRRTPSAAAEEEFKKACIESICYYQQHQFRH